MGEPKKPAPTDDAETDDVGPEGRNDQVEDAPKNPGERNPNLDTDEKG